MQTYQRKICLVGSFSVGKTSLVRRFVDGIFDDRYLSTIGVKISRSVVQLDEAAVKLLIWDLAGGDDALRSNDNYLRGLAGAVIVCDLTREDTLPIVFEYAEKIQTINDKAGIVLVGNKVDLVAQRAIDDAQLADAAERIGALACIVSSAKTGENVLDLFAQLAGGIV